MKNVPEQMLKALKKVGTRMKVKRKKETFIYYRNVRQLKVGDKVILSYHQAKIVKEYNINAHAKGLKSLRGYWDKVSVFLGFESFNQMILEYNFCFSMADNHRAMLIVEPCDGTITREQKLRKEKEYIEHKVV